MEISQEDVLKVLALFDLEDIPYIQSENLIRGLMMDDKEKREVEKPKVKKRGTVYDRQRK